MATEPHLRNLTHRMEKAEAAVDVSQMGGHPRCAAWQEHEAFDITISPLVTRSQETTAFTHDQPTSEENMGKLRTFFQSRKERFIALNTSTRRNILLISIPMSLFVV
mmetsp:Transcript_1029/g.2191  ORF Transcript_1029/g.2191 Transcript_1029/m.2191 type:complete len:107 (-) Transcript_1029:3052-3372(-)